MKKLFLSLVIVYSSLFSASCQIGVRTGLNLSTIFVQEMALTRIPTYKLDYHIGIDYNHTLGKPSKGLSINASLVYIRKGFKQNIENDTPIGFEILNRNLTTGYIDLPVTLRYHLQDSISGVFVEGGAYGSYILNADIREILTIENFDARDENNDIKNQFKTFDFGFVIGAGYRFKSPWTVGVSLHSGLINFFNQDIFDDEEKAGNRAVKLYVVYRI